MVQRWPLSIKPAQREFYPMVRCLRESLPAQWRRGLPLRVAWPHPHPHGKCMATRTHSRTRTRCRCLDALRGRRPTIRAGLRWTGRRASSAAGPPHRISFGVVVSTGPVCAEPRCRDRPVALGFALRRFSLRRRGHATHCRCVAELHLSAHYADFALPIFVFVHATAVGTHMR